MHFEHAAGKQRGFVRLGRIWEQGQDAIAGILDNFTGKFRGADLRNTEIFLDQLVGGNMLVYFFISL